MPVMSICDFGLIKLGRLADFLAQLNIREILFVLTSNELYMSAKPKFTYATNGKEKGTECELCWLEVAVTLMQASRGGLTLTLAPRETGLQPELGEVAACNFSRPVRAGCARIATSAIAERMFALVSPVCSGESPPPSPPSRARISPALARPVL